MARQRISQFKTSYNTRIIQKKNYERHQNKNIRYASVWLHWNVPVNPVGQYTQGNY